MKPIVIYCYDAYCGWCFGFSPVIKKIAKEYVTKLSFEVLSGGMVIAEKPAPVGLMANYILSAIPRVEEMTGVKFGEDYTWHLKNPDKSDWFPSSEKPAVALCIIKEICPENSLLFASDLQTSLFEEGRDLCDDEAYRHLLIKYGINEADFYQKLSAEAYKEKAYYDFSLCKQLQVTGYPCVLIQKSDSKFYVVAKGYCSYEQLRNNIEKVLGSN